MKNYSVVVVFNEIYWFSNNKSTAIQSNEARMAAFVYYFKKGQFQINGKSFSPGVNPSVVG